MAQVADALLYLSVLLLFTLSANALFQLGGSYTLPGGNPLTKLHPGTLLAVLALMARMIAIGPIRSIEIMLGRFPVAAVGAVCSAFGTFYIAVIIRLPITPVIETFLMPTILFAAIALRGPIPTALPSLLHTLFAANALLALVEFATGWRLSPFVAGSVILTDWRSTALFGHPLANALLGVTYVAVLLVARPNGLAASLRGPAMLLQLAALVAFGGRTAIVAAAALIGAAMLLAGARFLVGTRVRLWVAALMICAAIVAAAGVAALAQGGFFDPLVERFVSDDGSAKTRVVMFRVFDAISTEALWLGPDPELVGGLMRREGLEFGIESFPVAMVLEYGLVAAALLIGGMAALLAEIVRFTRPASLGAIAVFMLIALSFLSLASKTVLLAQLCAMLLAFYGPTPRAKARASAARAAFGRMASS